MRDSMSFSGEMPPVVDEPLPGIITLEDLFRPPPDDGFVVRPTPKLPGGPTFEADNLEHLFRQRRSHRGATIGSATVFLAQTEELMPA